MNNSGWTALHYGAYKDNIEIIKILIEAGADPDIKDNSEETPFMLCLKRSKNIDILNIFIELLDGLNYSDMHGRTALHYAAMNFQVEFVDYLLKQGLDPNDISIYGTPLHIATTNSEKSVEVMKRLIEEGADPNALILGSTPIHELASSGKYIIDHAKVLKEAGANINEEDLMTGNALHIAIKAQRPFYVIEELAQIGVDLSSKNYLGYTPLMYAYSGVLDEEHDYDYDLVEKLFTLAYQLDDIELINIGGQEYRIPAGFDYQINDDSLIIYGKGVTGQLDVVQEDIIYGQSAYDYAQGYSDHTGGSNVYECSLDQYCFDFYDSEYGSSTAMFIEMYFSEKIIMKASLGDTDVLNLLMPFLP